MASEISKSRLLTSKENFSGVKAVGFLPYVKNLTLTAGDVWEGGGMTGSVYTYIVKNDAISYEEVGSPSRDKGTTTYKGKLNLVLPTLDRATRDQVKLLAYGRPQIFIEKFDGTILLAGYQCGCECDSINMTTGAKRDDMSGFTLQFSTEEKLPMIFVGLTGSSIYNSSINLTGAIDPTI